MIVNNNSFESVRIDGMCGTCFVCHITIHNVLYNNLVVMKSVECA